jgi:hypothetical protein
LTKDFNF